MAEVITALKNRGKIVKGVGKMILNLGIANKYPIKMMEAKKKSYELRIYRLDFTGKYPEPPELCKMREK
jgi:hypothetical protein